MFEYYDKDGIVIGYDAYLHLKMEENYKRVAETTLPDGRWLSTVWLGLDMRFHDE